MGHIGHVVRMSVSGVQCYELFGGIALKNHVVFFINKDSVNTAFNGTVLYEK